jgi:SAM-dependent methyltransferase
MTNGQTKSKRRVADYGEVFTAEREVNAMLDLVKQETERIDSRFLEPACGNGNFLAEILRRKLAVVKSRYGKNPDDYERYAVIAVTSIYGVDILQDNVDECRERMFAIFDGEYTENRKGAASGERADNETREAVRHILKRNILCGDALTMETSGGEPIIFSEWAAANGCLIKRRDFRLDQMLKDSENAVQTGMFDGEARFEEDESGAAVLAPVREYPPVHYRRVVDHD